MKISFHIPLYNDNPAELIRVLLEQWNPGITEKINIWDDGSDEKHLSQLDLLKSRFKNHELIKWNHHPVNSGRAAIRQKILKNSDDSWNVSIDADMIPDTDFVSELHASLTNPDVIYQGRHYYQSHPPPPAYRLHWKYGRQRETKSKDASSFFTGIFAWHHSLTSRLYFDTSLRNYGHEDTLFRLLLSEQQIPIETIPAQALHNGLMDRDDFIKKQKEAIQNLIILQNHYPDFENSLIRYTQKIQKWPLLQKFISDPKINQWCIKKLHRPNPRLVFLDLLKLNEILQIK